MSTIYQAPEGWYPVVNDTLGTPDQWNEMQTGIAKHIQDYVQRMNPWNGVLAGLTPSIDGTDIAIAAGIGVYRGKLTLGTQGDPSPYQVPFERDLYVAFTGGDAAGTWYIYLDGAETDEEDSPKKTQTLATALGADCLLLAAVTWNGSDTLSDLIDLRQWGRDANPFECFVAGALGADTIHWTWIVDKPCAIRRPKARLMTCGSGAGPTVFDILTGANGATASIYSDSGDRFSIAHTDTDGAVVDGAYPDQNFVLAVDDVVELLTIGTPATGAADLAVIIPRFYYETIVV